MGKIGTLLLSREHLLPAHRQKPIEEIKEVGQFNIKASDWENSEKIEYHAPDGTVKVLKG